MHVTSITAAAAIGTWRNDERHICRARTVLISLEYVGDVPSYRQS